MAGKKVYPQLVFLECIIIAACTTAVYYLAPYAGLPHSFALFMAGMAADRGLTWMLRHRNKRLLPSFPISISRGTSRRRRA